MQNVYMNGSSYPNTKLSESNLTWMYHFTKTQIIFSCNAVHTNAPAILFLTKVPCWRYLLSDNWVQLCCFFTWPFIQVYFSCHLSVFCLLPSIKSSLLILDNSLMLSLLSCSVFYLQHLKINQHNYNHICTFKMSFLYFKGGLFFIFNKL